MEASREGELEELKRIVLLRERDAAEAFEKINQILAQLLEEPSESKKLEMMGRLRVAESVLFSSIGKLLAGYRAYIAALEKALKLERAGG
ncbi:hypothetical protein DRO53_02250 [Candidatus Bathyarchaeota archaeon]|nr:MAG: hypothetical protein DRO53_02250 [Candidatus Bathyarchaeota archaeon]